MKHYNSLCALLCILCANFYFAQTSTEMFETESNGSTSFTDNGVVFNIISHNTPTSLFDIANFPNTGWSGTSNDNRYIDNSGTATLENANVSFSIKTTSNLFKVNRFWVFLANYLINQNASGTLTITGKLNGITKFTQTKTTGFATSLGTTNGYTLIDLTNLNGQNYSNIIVDELRLTIGGDYRYLGLDAFTWVKDSNIILNALTLTDGGTTNVSCNAGSNGTAKVVVAGGTTPYTYSWAPAGGTGATATGLPAGNYTVTVKDAANNSNTRVFTITQPTALAVSGTQTNVNCNGTLGSATATVTGGTPAYTYSWSPTGGTGATATGLPAGDYTVTITDANACTITKDFKILGASASNAPVMTQNFDSGDKLSSFAVTGDNIKWYASVTDATNHTNVLPSTTAIVNNTIYYATQTVNACESTTSLGIRAYNPTLTVATVNKENYGVYPNPVKDILNIASQGKIDRISIVSATGNKVLDRKMESEKSVNLHQLISGVYFIQIYKGNEMETFKFVKE